MKRAIFILTLGLCLLLSDGAHAQRALPAMRGLEIRGTKIDNRFIAAFSVDLNTIVFKINISQIKSHTFRHTDSGSK